jgi:hypothetical protein
MPRKEAARLTAHDDMMHVFGEKLKTPANGPMAGLA